MALSDEQKNLLYQLMDYLDIKRNEDLLPDNMPRNHLAIKGDYTSKSHFEYGEKLCTLPEELRKGFLAQGIKKISVDFLVYKLGDDESGEDRMLRVGGTPIWVDLETRAMWPN